LNRGLVLISPIVLVRLLTVEDFGRYREFLLYATVLLNFAALGISGSLLRFIPERPELKWRFVTQTVLLTFASSVLVAAAALSIDAAFDGKALGEFAWPAVIYVLLFVNIDFWEYLLVAEHRSFAVLGYTTGRLVARMVTVIVAAYLTSDVEVVIWSIIGLEAVRLILSSVVWRRRAEPVVVQGTGTWRQQLEYCLPFGGSMIVSSLSASLGSLFVAKMIGPVALAHYTIGTYVQPIIGILRNSISDVLLPEMVARSRDSQADSLLLFRRTTVVITICLLAAAVLVARFAEALVVALFSEEYLPAVIVMQLFALAFVRECVDFGVPLRAINRTQPILIANALGIGVNLALLLVLLPEKGLAGAVGAYVVSRVVDGVYLAVALKHAYQVSYAALAPWKDLAKVAAAASLAAVVLYSKSWTDELGLIGVIFGGIVYVIAFAALLLLFRVPEAMQLLQWIRPATLLRRLR
jgi:O-antigen/teichoic acid export membrane protein